MQNLTPRFIAHKYWQSELHGSFRAFTLFMDISGFTTMTEELMRHGKAGAELLSKLLNEVFTEVTNIIYGHNGFISNFAGDACTAIFISDDPVLVTNVAFKIQRYFLEKPVRNTKLGHWRFDIKQGLSYGDVEWGIVGFDKYRTFYFRGEAINGCAEAEHQCSANEIIIDTRFIQQLRQVDPGYQGEVREGDYQLLLKASSYRSNIMYRIFNHLTKSYSFRNVPVLPDFSPLLCTGKSIDFSFKEIASVFISFDGFHPFEELNKFISHVLHLLISFEGFLSCLGYGDKGSTILVLFGMPSSLEDSAMRSLDFIHALHSTYGEAIKAGVAYGVTYTGLIGSSKRMEYTALGDVVNLSARLMVAAESSEILMSDAVMQIVQREYETELLGEKQFKGKHEKVIVYKLLKAIHFKEEGLHTAKFVGRKTELEKLNLFCRPFFENKFAGFIYVYGHPGIGKSKLLYEFTNPLLDKYKLIVLQTDNIIKTSLNIFSTFFAEYFEINSQVGDKDKYHLFVKKIQTFKKEFLENKPNTVHESFFLNLEEKQAFIAHLLNVHWSGSIYETTDARERFTCTIQAIKSFFCILSYIYPTIVVIEDAYGIDEDSKRALDYLVEDIDDVPMVIFVSCRLHDDGSTPKFLKKNHYIEKEIKLDTLTDEESCEMASSLFSKEIGPKLSAFILKKSANHPLYIEQICRFLLENKYLSEENNKLLLTQESISIPTEISSIISARIDRLPNKLKRLVQLASVLGDEFDVHILKILAKINQKEMLQLLEEGEQLEIWRPTSTKTAVKHRIKYKFTQILLHQTAYHMQPDEDLFKQHKQTAKICISLQRNAIYNEFELLNYIVYHYNHAKEVKLENLYLEKLVNYVHLDYKSENAIEYYSQLIDTCDDALLKLQLYGRMSEIYELDSKLDKAIDKLEEGIQYAEQLSSFSSPLSDEATSTSAISMHNTIADLKAFLGDLYQQNHMYEQAIKVIQDSIAMAMLHNNHKVLSKAYINLSTTLIKQGHYYKSIEYLQTAYNLTKSHYSLPYYLISINILCQMSNINLMLGNYKEAYHFYKSASMIFVKANLFKYTYHPSLSKKMKKNKNIYASLKHKKVILLEAHSKLLIYRGLYKKAYKVAKQTFNSCVLLQTKPGMIQARIMLATIQEYSQLSIPNQEHSSDAVSFALQTITLCDKQHIQGLRARALYALAFIYGHRLDIPNTIYYIQEATVMLKQKKDSALYSQITSLLAYAYVLDHKLESALKIIYYHVQNKKDGGMDAEHGLIYVVLALILVNNQTELRPLDQQQISYIEKAENFSLQDPITCFEKVIRSTQGNLYYPTQFLAKYHYGVYLARDNQQRHLSIKMLQDALRLAKQAHSLTDIKLARVVLQSLK